MLIINVVSLAAVGLIVAGFLVALDRRDAREREERAGLLQRIQAPHAAVAEHHYRAEQPVEPGSGLPMSDAEVAKIEGGRVPDVDAETKKWIAQVEAIENGSSQLLDGVIQ